MNVQREALYRVKEVALLLNVSAGTVYRRCADGELEYVQFPTGHRRIPGHTVLDYIQRYTVPAQPHHAQPSATARRGVPARRVRSRATPAPRQPEIPRLVPMPDRARGPRIRKAAAQ